MMLRSLFRNIKTLQKGMSEGFTGEKTEQMSAWDRLYAAMLNKEILQSKIDGVEDEKLIIFFDNIKGIIPADEIGGTRPKYLSVLVGAPVAFKVVRCERSKNEVYLSRKKAIEEMAEFTWEELKRDCDPLMDIEKKIQAAIPKPKGKKKEEKKVEHSPEVRKAIAELNDEARRTGPVRTGTVRTVVESGAYMDIGGVTAFLPKYEISWGRVDDARDTLKPGESFDVRVIKVNFETKQVRVSLKALLPDPWETVPTRYIKDGKYAGEVRRITSGGKVEVELEPSVVVVCPPLSLHALDTGTPVRVHISKLDAENRYILGTIVGESRWAS